ncbi:MAG: hypothetical protein AB7F50_08240 [Fimbriimonadaceae bacterium]
MKAALEALLAKSLEYAGLFPPAKLEMGPAVTQYLAQRAGSDGWIVNRFVCPVSRLEELGAALDPGKEVRATVVGRPANAASDLERDARAIAECPGNVIVQAYEAKIGDIRFAHKAGRPLAKVADEFVADGWPLFVEFVGSGDRSGAMQELSASLEDVGFKLRTGGVETSMFPSTEDVADFIVEVASLNVPVKFTAGLHEPLRHWDDGLRAWHHGFVAVLSAACLALSGDLSRREVAEVLECPKFLFSDDSLEVLGHRADLDDIESFRDLFGGFGSCSVDEPIEGLRRLGWLPEVVA